MSERSREIHEKGFTMGAANRRPVEQGNIIPETDYSRIKVGLKTLEDAVLSLDQYKKVNPRLGDKKAILQAINSGNVNFMRESSNFFFKVSGIYSRLCKHLANLYRYDWYLTTQLFNSKYNSEKIIEEYYRVLNQVDEFKVKQFFSNVALAIFRNGCYYGYLVKNNQGTQVQELDPNYCRSRYFILNKPAIEFNMKFFDDAFKDVQYRLKVLNLFPKEFKKGYFAYKDGKLVPDYPGDDSGWYLLDPECAFKFNMNGEDYPPFFSVIPHIIDLDAAQELDRKRMAQKLLKIIIQKMPVDKNGELIFDVDEAQELHNNAVRMLGKAIGIDVLTTFADVDVADMADKSTVAAVDDLAKMERAVFNESGTAQNLFNTDGNIALEKSILDDEANMYSFLLQCQDFLNELIKPFNKGSKKAKAFYKIEMLPTTVYNYKEFSKLYKEQSNVAGSKLLANIALGQSQASVLAAARFENEILDVTKLFSSQQTLKEAAQKSAQSQPKETTDAEEKKPVGRQPKPDDEKSAKTIQNIESMG